MKSAPSVQDPRKDKHVQRRSKDEDRLPAVKHREGEIAFQREESHEAKV